MVYRRDRLKIIVSIIKNPEDWSNLEMIRNHVNVTLRLKMQKDPIQLQHS